jgi:hypothetical protein
MKSACWDTIEPEITLEEASKYFTGGWSYHPAQMMAALNNVVFDNTLRILEFGAGKGTLGLVNLLTDRGIPFEYVSYENNPAYIPKTDKVKFIMYDEFPANLAEVPFLADLILVDGPNGVSRIKWYPLIREIWYLHTVLVIDDFSHYKEFETELDKNFKYEMIEDVNLGKQKWSAEVSWRTVCLRKNIRYKNGIPTTPQSESDSI